MRPHDRELLPICWQFQRPPHIVLLYSPVALNQAFAHAFQQYGWQKHINYFWWEERRKTFWVTNDERVLRSIQGKTEDEQKEMIRASGHEPIMTYNQTDFVKDRVAILNKG